MTRKLKNIIPADETVETALALLNEGIGGAVFCVDDAGVMTGILTDGDIRRGLLKGATLQSPVSEMMNVQFVRGHEAMGRDERLALLGPVVRHLPVLNDLGQPVDMLSWSEIWKLPISMPSLGGNEVKYVVDCIETSWVSSQGKYVTEFQDAFSAYHQGGHSLCTSSGTTALHLALLSVGVGQGMKFWCQT